MSSHHISEDWMNNRKNRMRIIKDDFTEILYELTIGYDRQDAIMQIQIMKAEMTTVIDGLEFARSKGHMMPFKDASRDDSWQEGTS